MVLLIFLLILVVLPRFMGFFLSEYIALDAGVVEEIEQFLSAEELVPEVSLFSFDPNATDSASWVSLGFSGRQIQTINNYLAKGGQFRHKEDFKKIYAVTEQDYLRVADYIQIAPRSRPTASAPIATRPEKYVPSSQPPPIMIELNTADSLDLLDLRGIGSVFSSRIVRFRERLGGFYHMEQLLEVYGMDSARMEGILPFIHVDKNLVKKININTIDESALRRHPYVDTKMAVLIIRYRDQHGPFHVFDDLLRIIGIAPEKWDPLVPYLVLN